MLMKFLKSYKQFESNIPDRKTPGFNFCFRSGDCDIYAIALHRLYGYPIYAINGYYKEPDWNEEMGWTGYYDETAHLVVKLPNGNYLDCDGESTEEELKSQCAFGNKIEYIKFEEISENEAMDLFSYDPNKEEDIKNVMAYIQDNNKLNESKGLEDKKYIKLKGTIVFDPKDVTRKHKKQAAWKKVAMVMFEKDHQSQIPQYYAWLIKKRYNLELNRPLRGAHVSFINDSVRDIAKGLGVSEDEAYQKWEEIKDMWDGQEVEVYFDPDARTNGEHWWLMVPEEKRKDLHGIRAQLGLGRPFYGLHMSIGYANERNIDHSNYIHRLVKNRGGSYN